MPAPRHAEYDRIAIACARCATSPATAARPVGTHRRRDRAGVQRRRRVADARPAARGPVGRRRDRRRARRRRSSRTRQRRASRRRPRLPRKPPPPRRRRCCRAPPERRSSSPPATSASSSATRTGSSATGGSASTRSVRRSRTSTARWFPTRPLPTALELAAEPQTIIGSPNDEQAIAVSKPDASNGSEVIVFALPKPSEAPESVAPETGPPASEQPTATARHEPPAGSEPPSTASAAPETPPASDAPSASPPRARRRPKRSSPAMNPNPTPGGDRAPTTTPTPGVGRHRERPYRGSADGGLLAGWQLVRLHGATGRREPGSGHLPVARRDQRAEPVTDDHRSVFASWAGDRLVGSRPAETEGGRRGGGREHVPARPRDGAETALDMQAGGRSSRPTAIARSCSTARLRRRTTAT